MQPDAIIAALVTVLTSSGFVATIGTIGGVIAKARAGQKIRESARRDQIAATTPTAGELADRARATKAEADFDAERALRRTWQDLAHEMRRFCIDHGTPLAALPAFPDDH